VTKKVHKTFVKCREKHKTTVQDGKPESVTAAGSVVMWLLLS